VGADAIDPAAHAREKWLTKQMFSWLPDVATISVQPGWFADNYFAVLGHAAQFECLGCRWVKARTRPHPRICNFALPSTRLPGKQRTPSGNAKNAAKTRCACGVLALTSPCYAPTLRTAADSVEQPNGASAPSKTFETWDAECACTLLLHLGLAGFPI
jgi:hypothetical protein